MRKKIDITFENLKIIADAIAKHNGDDCEVCIHDLTIKNISHSIVYIVNSHVTGRKVGESFSFNYLKSRKILEEGKEPANKIELHNRTVDGKILKCSTLYIKDLDNKYHYMLCINQDVSSLVQANNTLTQLMRNYDENENEKDTKLSLHVNDILDELIDSAVKFVGKSPIDMVTEDKKKAIKFLNDAGAFLIAKSGDKISEYFNISKFTIYSYINSEKNNNKGEVYAKN